MGNHRIGIVGGGLAGLTAAYRLLQGGATDVTVYESGPTCGGRIQSRTIRGEHVDFGGFLIYPWYAEGHKLFADLHIDTCLVQTPLDDILYILNEDGGAITEDAVEFPPKETVKIWTKSLLKILQKSPLSEPDLDRFDGKTISEYLRAALDTQEHAGIYETFFDTVSQGYCYGSVQQTKAAFMMPIVRQVKLHGDVRTTSFFPQGSATIIEHLVKEITALGGTIQCNTPITKMSEHTLQSHDNHFAHDVILFAQNVSPELYRNILPDVQPACTYTQFLTVAVALNATPTFGTSQPWGAAFYAPNDSAPEQILSVINASSLYGTTLAGCAVLNIVLRDRSPESMTDETIDAITRREIARLFPAFTVESILESVHWKNTMPIAQESFVQAVRDAQGKNGYYFAGDFLGAPSIETAIATGTKAAQHILDDYS